MTKHKKRRKRRNRKGLSKARSPETKGALHRQLGIPQDEKIGKKRLRKIVRTPLGKKALGKTVTPLMKQRAVWALNINA